MSPFVRSLLAVLAGLVTGIVVIGVMEQINSLVFPLPAGVDPRDLAALKAAMANLPAGALAGVLIGWGAATVAASWLAARLGRRAPTIHALVVGALLMVMSIANMLILPHPLWFWIVSLALFLPLSWVGGRLADPARRAGA